jgi:hypothetical protein
LIYLHRCLVDFTVPTTDIATVRPRIARKLFVETIISTPFVSSITPLLADTNSKSCIAACPGSGTHTGVNSARCNFEAMLPDWTLAPIMVALQTMRGMALVNAATLIAELGDLPRLANPCQLMAYIGLVPSEHSSGASVKRGGLTKAGNSAARRLLIEAAWCYRFPGPRQPRASVSAGGAAQADP